MNNQDRARQMVVDRLGALTVETLDEFVEDFIRHFSVATLIELLRLSLPGYIREMPEYRSAQEEALSGG